jgi:hypothetical protein
LKILTLILTILWPTLSLAEPAADPSLFKAAYVAKFQGLQIKAKGVRELQRLENGDYRLTSSATSMLAIIIETSEFSFAGGQLKPIRYDYTRRGLGKSKQSFIAFDYGSQTLQHPDGTSELIRGTLDKLSYQYQLTQDLTNQASSGRSSSTFDYVVADGDKLKKYRFRVAGEELLKTPIGDIMTVIIERIREQGSDRKTTFWLAKNHDYLLTKFKQQGNGKSFELNLESFTLDE